MKGIVKDPQKSLNKAFLKIKVYRSEIDKFKTNIGLLISRINTSESEEYQKNLISDFLKKTYYEPTFYINVKDRNDLVIHNDSNPDSSVAVIIEVKNPTNKSEMVSRSNLNRKALQELALYYFRERITANNLEIKHLIITNTHEWFIFDAQVFEKYFKENSELTKQFKAFESHGLSGTKTKFFYKDVLEPYIESIKGELSYTYFDLKAYQPSIEGEGTQEDKELIALFKVLSPEHLLKLPFVNDSNNLNRSFYAELLHIIGLEESKQGSKHLIGRKPKDSRSAGFLIENAITQLDNSSKISRLDLPLSYGKTIEEKGFNISLELVITWINRILFLKLLEAQLNNYNSTKESFSFLSNKVIHNFTDLNNLFFGVLAKRHKDRQKDISERFNHVPYLNSSLFEPTSMEKDTIFISNLDSNIEIPIHGSTVLKDATGKKRKGSIKAIEYILDFLDSYDFSSEGSAEIQEENKTLISASVLGLIFEKINGYKDGSYFTPGYITMFMCRESLRRAILNRFKEHFGFECHDFDSLYNMISEDKRIGKSEVNQIINSIKICDPAVGSGHFLVSCLNELIAIKSDLKVLMDSNGRTLRDYEITVENDELTVLDENGCLFKYHPNSKESLRVQKTLFHEKQQIIENCLFGVDVNENSVKICRLRLWIELLKNAYFNETTSDLETLPNLDINIKCGNSLVSLYAPNVNSPWSAKKSKGLIAEYNTLVGRYKKELNKDIKYQIEKSIDRIKDNFKIAISECAAGKELKRAIADRQKAYQKDALFETDSERLLREAYIKTKDKKIKSLESKIAETSESGNIKNSSFFEWRFEFPEILREDGCYSGFDLVIGNPPYGVHLEQAERDRIIYRLGKVPDHEIFYFFINLSHNLLRSNGILSFIVPNTILFNHFAKKYRKGLLEKYRIIDLLDLSDYEIFSDATIRNSILIFKKETGAQKVGYKPSFPLGDIHDLLNRKTVLKNTKVFIDHLQNWSMIIRLPEETLELVQKIKNNSIPFSDKFPNISQGLIAYDKWQGQSEDIISSRAYHSNKKTNKEYKSWLKGEDVRRYVVDWNGTEYIKYGKHLANPREPKYFQGNRILVREITNPRIYAAFASAELYNDPAIINILEAPESNIGTFALLGILNSKLATFYHFKTSPKAAKGSFPKILVDDIKNFPIPATIDKEIHNKLVQYTRKVFEIKQIDYDTDTQKVEEKIDSLVYKVYGLNRREVDIIDKEIL